MPMFRIKEAASILGVSHDTLCRWADAGLLETTTDAAGRMAVADAALAQLAQELAESSDRAENPVVIAHSARNRFSGPGCGGSCPRGPGAVLGERRGSIFRSDASGT